MGLFQCHILLHTQPSAHEFSHLSSIPQTSEALGQHLWNSLKPLRTCDSNQTHDLALKSHPKFPSSGHLIATGHPVPQLGLLSLPHGCQMCSQRVLLEPVPSPVSSL